MPIELTRIIGEECGLDLNEKVLNMMIGHICDYKLSNIMKNIR
jgi:hypothetical protein